MNKLLHNKWFAVIVIALTLGFVLTTHLNKAYADEPLKQPCITQPTIGQQPANGVYNVWYFCTYFDNDYQNILDFVFPPIGSTNYWGLTKNWETKPITETSFDNAIEARLFDKTSQINNGRAAAIVDIMLGREGNTWGQPVNPRNPNPPDDGVPAGINYAQTNFTAWKNLVNSYATSTNPNYSVDFYDDYPFTPQNSPDDGMGSYTGNFDLNHRDKYACTTRNCSPDVAFINNQNGGDNSSDLAVVFTYPGGHFIIKAECGNLSGDIAFLPAVPTPPVNLQPNVTSTVNGTPSTTAAVGDTINFDYSVNNPDLTASATTTCTVYDETFAGFHATPTGPPYDTPPPGSTTGTGCPKPFSPGNTPLYTSPNISVTAGNQTICSTLVINSDPSQDPANNVYSEACVTTVAPTCSVATVDPESLDPKEPFTITATVQYNPTTVATQAFGPDTFYIDVPGVGNQTTTTPQIPGAAGAGSATFTASFPQTGSTGTFDFTYGTNGSIAPINCTSSFSVADLPYFNVLGGDAATGAGMDQSGTDCAVGPDPKASIVGWNKEAAGNYAGAGTQYAATVLNYLQDFATAQGSSGVPAAPSGLSFANTLNVSSGGLFGGAFGSESCIPDYYSPPSNVSTGNFYINGLNPTGVSTNSSATPITVANGTHTNIYIDGNAYITGNIVYSNNYPNGVSDIPSYTLVVKGNIYIAPGVSQLNGLYVAEPDGPGTGIIYTCATTFAQPNLDGTLYNTCNTSTLTVNGSFIAQQVWLVRTAGTLSTTPAETFNYSPELWLTTPPASGVGITGENTDYDAITGLPPTF